MREMEQIKLDMVFASERGRRGIIYDKQIIKKCVELAEVLGLIRDEVRCRELMRASRSDEVTVALDNLRRLLRNTRKLLART